MANFKALIMYRIFVINFYRDLYEGEEVNENSKPRISEGSVKPDVFIKVSSSGITVLEKTAG